MKTCLLITITSFLFNFNCVLAQTSTLSYYKNQLKISLFRYIDPINPGAEISFERITSKKSSFQLSISYLDDLLSTTNRVMYGGYRISVEKKYFVFNLDDTRFYVAADFFFASFKYSNEANWRRKTYI